MLFGQCAEKQGESGTVPKSAAANPLAAAAIKTAAKPAPGSESCSYGQRSDAAA